MNKRASLKNKYVTLLACSLMSFNTYVFATSGQNNSSNRIVMSVHATQKLQESPSIIHIEGTNSIIIDIPNIKGKTNLPINIRNNTLIKDIKKQTYDSKVRFFIDVFSPVEVAYVKNARGFDFVFTPASSFNNTIPANEVKAHIVEKLGGKSNHQNDNLGNTTIFKSLNRINVENTNGNTNFNFHFSNNLITPIIKRTSDQIEIILPNTNIATDMQRRVSLTGLGGQTQSVDISMVKNGGRILIKQKGNFQYGYSLVNNVLSLSINPITEKEELSPKFTGEKLSLNFQNMDVRAILQVIADFTGINIMSSDAVTGSMTIRLNNIPWDQALDLVLKARNLQKIKEGNVIWVATREEVLANNRTRLELQNQGLELEPLQLEFFQINYYRAADLRDILEGGQSTQRQGQQGGGNKGIRILSNRGSVGVDPRNNILFIQDTPSRLGQIKKLIAKLDRPTRQVLIEAKIVVADHGFSRELGARLGVRLRGSSNNTSIGIGGNLANSRDIASGGGEGLQPITNLATTGNLSSAIGITLLRASGNALGLEISALEENNRGKVISNPRLLTTDNKRATIEQGTQIPYVTPGSADSPATVSFKDAVLRLDVTPQITPSGRIVMDLNLRKDTIGELVNVQGGGQVPSIDTRNLDTEVTIGNGQTVVLGGIHQSTNRSGITGVPFFSDLPGIGNLFRLRNNMETTGELLIFITPHIVEHELLEDENNSQQRRMISIESNN